MFQRQSAWVRALDEPGVFASCFDRQGDAINKLDARTIAEFGRSVGRARAVAISLLGERLAAEQAERWGPLSPKACRRF